MAKIKTKTKKTRIDAENPLTLWTTARQYVEENARQIGAVALAVAVLAGAVFAWSMMRARSEQDSLNMFHAALAVMAPEGKAGQPQPAQYEKALAQFRQLREKHGGTQSGKIALLYAGSCQYNLKKYDEAVQSYQEFLDAAHGNLQYLRGAALEGLGYSFEGKGDFKAAAEWFEKQKSESDGSGSSLLNLARVLELGGDRQKACQQYKEFLEKNPLSAQKQFAQIKADSVCPKKGS
jgi:tetratricopeptide (TPR) repeat protein